jgi:AcrR family transcriptional regulator
MHSMTEGATTRERRRLETERRITVCAQRLTDERGLDGFTMDELAEAAEVSRRTLFNYFPSKVDAVLGNPPDLPPSVLATFHAGGPHGHLVDDLGELAAVLLSTKTLTREEMELGHRVVTTTPRLIMAAHERFQELTSEFVHVILAREGEEFGEARARLLIRLLVAIFDGCIPSHGDEPDRPLAEIFTESLRTARELLA